MERAAPKKKDTSLIFEEQTISNKGRTQSIFKFSNEHIFKF